MLNSKGTTKPKKNGGDYLDRYLILIVFLLSSFIVFISSGYGRGNPGESRAQDNRRQSSSVYQIASNDRAQLSDLIQTVYQKVNAYRVSQDLHPLTLNPFLSNLAREHSQSMATGEIPFGHSGIERRTQAIEQKFSYRSIAENVGYTMESDNPARKVVENWLKSPAHRKNISGDFELTGIGVAKSDKGQYHFTQIFLKR